MIIKIARVRLAQKVPAILINGGTFETVRIETPCIIKQDADRAWIETDGDLIDVDGKHAIIRQSEISGKSFPTYSSAMREG